MKKYRFPIVITPMSEGGFLVRCEQVKATATRNTARGATESLSSFSFEV